MNQQGVVQCFHCQEPIDRRKNLVVTRIRGHVHPFHYGCYEELEGNRHNIFGKPPYRLCRFNRSQLNTLLWIYFLFAIGIGITTLAFAFRGTDQNNTLLALFGFVSLSVIALYVKILRNRFDEHAKEGLERFESKLPE